MTDATVKPLSNAQQQKLRVFREIAEIGRSEGTGKVARMKLIEKVVFEAGEGLIVTDDAGEVWTTMMQASGDAQREVGGADPKDTAQRTSDIKNFITLGINRSIDGPAVIDNAKRRMQLLRSTGVVKNARIWEMMLTFARAQNKSPEHPLTDAEIDKLFEDKERQKRELADVVWTHRQGLLKANEGEDRADIYKACDDLAAVVDALGGTGKQRKEARAAAAKQAAEDLKNGVGKPKGRKGKGIAAAAGL